MVDDELIRVCDQDQAIQESGVKIELIEKRAEATKKQADVALELEEELSKVRKQEKDQEAAMQQLQKDMDELERENSRLKQSASSDRNSKLPTSMIDHS
jgi:dynactin 1